MEFKIVDSPFIEGKDEMCVSFYFTDFSASDENEGIILNWASSYGQGKDENTLLIDCPIKNLLDFKMESIEHGTEKGLYDIDYKKDFEKIRSDLQYLIAKIDAMKFA